MGYVLLQEGTVRDMWNRNQHCPKLICAISHLNKISVLELTSLLNFTYNMQSKRLTSQDCYIKVQNQVEPMKQSGDSVTSGPALSPTSGTILHLFLLGVVSCVMPASSCDTTSQSHCCNQPALSFKVRSLSSLFLCFALFVPLGFYFLFRKVFMSPWFSISLTEHPLQDGFHVL